MNPDNQNSSFKEEYKNKPAIDVAYDVGYSIMNKLFKQGKIIAGKDNANPTKTIGQYVTLQNMLLNRARNYQQGIAGASDSFVQEYNRLKERYENREIDEEQFRNLASNIIRSLEKFHEVIIDKISENNASFNKVSKDIKEDSQGLVEFRDKMLKKRILYLVLMISPFLSIPVLDMVANNLSGLFDPNATIGESVSQSVIGLKRLGFFGDFLDMIEIDKVLKYFFDDAPLISNVFGLVEDVGETQLGGALGLIIKSVVASPLPYIGAAITGVAKFTEGEMEFYDKKSSAYKSAKSSIESVYDKADKDRVNSFEKYAIEAVKSEFDALETSYKMKKINHFIVNHFNNKPLLHAVLSDLKEIKSAQNIDDAKKMLMQLDEKEVEKLLKKVVVAENIYDQKIYDALKKHSNQDFLIDDVDGKKIKLKDLLNRCQNGEGLRQDYMDIFAKRGNNVFPGILDQSFVDSAAIDMGSYFTKRYKEEDHKDLLDSKIKEIKNYFCLTLINRNSDEFEKRGWNYSKSIADPDYYDHVKKFYGDNFADKFTQNATHKKLEEGVMPPKAKKGDEPINLKEKVEMPELAKQLWGDLKIASGDEGWVDKIQKQRSPSDGKNPMQGLFDKLGNNGGSLGR